MPLLLPVIPTNSEHVGKSTCCCQRSLSLNKRDLGLSLLGIVGWLALPKCPLCFAAWFAMLSGLSLSVGASNAVLLALTIVAAGCFLVGAIRLGNAVWKNLSKRDISQPDA
jgi:hypothetical protein